MSYLMLALRLLPSVIGLMGIAERAYKNKPKSGPEKKEFVKEAAGAIVDGVSEVSTGGQKETWDEIDNILDPFIDIAARIMFWKDD